MGRTYRQKGIRQECFQSLTGKPTGKRPLRRPRCRLGNIRMYHNEISANVRSWIDSAQDRDYYRVIVIAAFNL